MNNTFDFNRFKMVVKWDAFTNKAFYLRSTLGLALGLSLFCIFGLYTFRENWMDETDAAKTFYGVFMNTMVGNTMLIATIGFFCFAGNCFHNMNNKLRRATYLMLPATKLEKYLARFFNITVGGFILCLVAILIADFVQFIFSFIITPGFHASLTYSNFQFMNYMAGRSTNEVIALSAIIWSTVIFVHSFYTLGSTIFSKYALLITTGIGIVLIYISGYSLKDAGINISINDGTDTFCYNSLIYAAILLVLSAICYLSSYKLFTRMQVINNKWINI